MSSSRKALRIASLVEILSLLVLFANLATAHLPQISSLIGPTHGCAYLLVIVLAFQQPTATATTKAVAAIPGFGGLLALRRLGPASEH